VLSVYYCGFGGNFCGQSTDNDVYPKTTHVILAFANTQADGSIIIDEPNFPTQPYQEWKTAGKNVLISIGGQNGNWANVFASNTSATNFINAVVDIVDRFNLDGVDLDIEYYGAAPRAVANMICALRAKLDALGTGKKLITASPECVVIYQAMGVPDADTGSGYNNYFVPIVKLADQCIDFYQPQAYNNWYEFPSGSVDYLKDVYLNWRNLQGMTPWGCSPIANFSGIAGEKIVMGIPSSTTAAGSAYYYTPAVINDFKTWLDANNYPLAGFMTWDSHWDTLNGNEATQAARP